MKMSLTEVSLNIPTDHMANVFGQFDEHLKLIERTLNVTLISRDGMLKILGTEQSATQAKKLIEELVTLAGRGNTITRQNVSYALSLAMEERNQVLTEIDKDFICNTIQGRPIKPKTLGQQEYVEQIRKKMSQEKRDQLTYCHQYTDSRQKLFIHFIDQRSLTLHRAEDIKRYPGNDEQILYPVHPLLLISCFLTTHHPPPPHLFAKSHVTRAFSQPCY